MSQPAGSAGLPAGDVPILGHDATSAMEAGMRRSGILCVSCGRMTGEPDCDPIEVIRIDPSVSSNPSEKVQVQITRLVVCGREDCDPSADEMKATAHAWRPYVGWKVPTKEEMSALLAKGGAAANGQAKA